MSRREGSSFVDPRECVGVDEIAVASATGGDASGATTHLVCVGIRGTRLGVGEPVEIPELVFDQEGTVAILAQLIRAGSDAWGRDEMVAAFAAALGVPAERAARTYRRVDEVVREEGRR